MRCCRYVGHHLQGRDPVAVIPSPSYGEIGKPTNAESMVPTISDHLGSAWVAIDEGVPTPSEYQAPTLPELIVTPMELLKRATAIMRTTTQPQAMMDHGSNE